MTVDLLARCQASVWPAAVSSDTLYRSPASSAKRLNSAGTPPIPSPFRSLTLSLRYVIASESAPKVKLLPTNRIERGGSAVATAAASKATIIGESARRAQSQSPCAAVALHR